LALRPGWRPEATFTSPLEWVAFWKLLTKPHIRSLITAGSVARRKNARVYFAQMGLLDAVPKGFVDLGWFLTTQSALCRVCRDGLTRPSIRGYYLGLKRFRMSPAEAGPASSLFREHAPDLPCAPHLTWLQRNYLIEQIIGFADHPSVKAYAAEGIIEYVPSSQSGDSETFRRVEEAVVTYVERFGAHWKTFGESDDRAASFLGTLLNELLFYPSSSCIHLLQNVRFSPDPGRENTERLIEPYSWFEALFAWRGKQLVHRSTQGKGWRWWPEASEIATPHARRKAREVIISFRR
jgi:hypothetical protein